LEANPNQPPPDNFKTLIPPLLTPALWETRGNVPGCSWFLSAIIPKAKDAIQANDQLTAVLGIFQQLMTTKKTEQNGFDVLEAIVSSFPA
jgi:exportin-2 (importin alpha re-exporter)